MIEPPLPVGLVLCCEAYGGARCTWPRWHARAVEGEHYDALINVRWRVLPSGRVEMWVDEPAAPVGGVPAPRVP